MRGESRQVGRMILFSEREQSVFRIFVRDFVELTGERTRNLLEEIPTIVIKATNNTSKYAETYDGVDSAFVSSLSTS